MNDRFRRCTWWPLLAVLATCGPLVAPARGAEEFHPNHIAVIVGGVTPVEEAGDTSFLLGADYERRLNEDWGVMVVTAFTFGAHTRASILGIAMSYRPIPALRFGIGPGVEFVEAADSSDDGNYGAHALVGVSAFYEFHLGPLAVGPTLVVDFLSETHTNLSYGISVGRGF